MNKSRSTFTTLRGAFHTFPTTSRWGVKCKTARRQGAFHAFHGFHTYRRGCVRDARARSPAPAPARLIHTPLSVGVKSVKSVKSQDGTGLFWGGRCETGVKFHTFTATEGQQ